LLHKKGLENIALPNILDLRVEQVQKEIDFNVLVHIISNSIPLNFFVGLVDIERIEKTTSKIWQLLPVALSVPEIVKL
jgi:hypothetical protein